MVTNTASENYLIIGGLGYIGSHLANYIIEHYPSATVTIFDGINKNSNLYRISGLRSSTNRLALIVGDVANEALLTKAMTDYKIDVIFYCSTCDETTRYRWNPVGVARNNILGFAHTLEAIRSYKGLKKLVYVSSEEVYGSKTSTKSESIVSRPETSVAASIAGAEYMLYSYFISYRLPLIIARLSHIVFGGDMNNENSLSSLISEVDRKYWDQTSNCKSYGLLQIQDAIDGLMCCASEGKPGEIYNIGGSSDISDQMLCRLVAAVRDGAENVSEEIQLTQPSMGSTKAANTLGWFPKKDNTLKELISCIQTVLKPKSEPMKPSADMALKFMIYGAGEWITKELIKQLVEKGINYCIGSEDLEMASDEAIVKEIIDAAPSHIILIVGNDSTEGRVVSGDSSGNPSELRKNTDKYLYIPWLLASICDKNGIHFTYLASSSLFTFDDKHPVLGAGFTESDLPNYFGDNISVIKGYTDRIMHFFMNTLNARMRMPFSSNQKWMLKTSEYINVPVSITILPSCLPVLVDMATNRVCGTINLVNPGTISLSEVAAKYKKVVEPDFQYRVVELEDYDPHKAEQALCVLDTTKLQKLYPHLRSVDQELHGCLSSAAAKKDRSTLQQA